MSRVLIGSSNIYKHYRATAFPRFKEYSMVRCVDIDSFKAQIGDSNIRAFTFIDAIIRYGAVLVQADLDEAYRRAGSAFRGQLEQHFVVLHESGGHAKAGAGGSSSSGRGTGSGGSGGWARPGGSGESGKLASKFNPKRQREDESSKSAFKKSKN
jgi:hypothetical protein